MATTAAVAGVASPASKALAPKNAFATLMPSMLRRHKDGGSMSIDGRILGGVKVTIRLDGGVNSPTRGQFFALTHPAKGGAQGQRMTKAELRDLNEAITKHMARTPGRQPDYVRFNDRLRDALGAGAPKIDLEKVPTSVVGPNASAAVEGTLWTNGMPGPGPKPVIGVVNLQGAGFNDALPKFNVTKLEVYERGTNRLLHSVANPKPIDTDVQGKGMAVRQFRVEFAQSKVKFGRNTPS